jgi:hypothetical protein
VAHLRDRRDDRGQIILLGAFALGVTFVALALVVNSAIFTENLAARGDTTGAGDALEYRHELEANVATILESVNDDDSPSEAQIKQNVSNINIQGGLQNAEYGRIVSVSYVSGSAVDGTELYQEQPADFTNIDDNETWQLARNVDDARAVRFNVSDPSELEDGQTDAFRIALNDTTGGWWNMSIDDDEIIVNRADGTQKSCDYTASSGFTVDATRGWVAGEPCHALQRSDGDRMYFGEGVDPSYEIWFANADEIEGTYSMVVDDGAVPVFTTTSPGPLRKDVYYSANVTYTYETARLSYQTTITVAPGEPHE